jgi:hypothetical protein
VIQHASTSFAEEPPLPLHFSLIETNQVAAAAIAVEQAFVGIQQEAGFVI